TAGLNVTVSAAPGPSTALQGSVVPLHVEELRSSCPLQPANVEPTLALGSNVTVAPFVEVLMFGEQVLETVWDGSLLPVPPHDVGALMVPALTEIFTVPLPLPANVRVQLRAATT